MNQMTKEYQLEHDLTIRQLHHFMEEHGTKDMCDIGGHGSEDRLRLFGWHPDVYDYALNNFDICKKPTLRQYGTVICCNTMEHVYDPVRAAENIVKSIKPNGWLFCTTVFNYDFHPYDDVADMYRYTTTALEYLFRNLKKERCWFEEETLPGRIRVTYIGRKNG